MARLEPFQVESTPAGNSLRRTWLWALNRSPAPLTSKQDAAKLDMFLAKRWFGPGLQNLDTRLLDFLANWFPKNHESLDERERLEFLAALQSALGDRKGTLPQQTDPANLMFSTATGVGSSSITRPCPQSLGRLVALPNRSSPQQ